jgi:hypothetical protein
VCSGINVSSHVYVSPSSAFSVPTVRVAAHEERLSVTFMASVPSTDVSKASLSPGIKLIGGT